MRYCAIRAESFDPGGCSTWPTSPFAVAAIPPPPPCGAEADCSAWANDVAGVPAPSGVAVAPPIWAGAADGPGGRRAVLIWLMRERTVSRLTRSYIG